MAPRRPRREGSRRIAPTARRCGGSRGRPAWRRLVDLLGRSEGVAAVAGLEIVGLLKPERPQIHDRDERLVVKGGLLHQRDRRDLPLERAEPNVRIIIDAGDAVRCRLDDGAHQPAGLERPELEQRAGDFHVLHRFQCRRLLRHAEAAQRQRAGDDDGQGQAEQSRPGASHPCISSSCIHPTTGDRSCCRVPRCESARRSGLAPWMSPM